MIISHTLPVTQRHSPSKIHYTPIIYSNGVCVVALENEPLSQLYNNANQTSSEAEAPQDGEKNRQRRRAEKEDERKRLTFEYQLNFRSLQTLPGGLGQERMCLAEREALVGVVSVVLLRWSLENVHLKKTRPSHAECSLRNTRLPREAKQGGGENTYKREGEARRGGKWKGETGGGRRWPQQQQ